MSSSMDYTPHHTKAPYPARLQHNGRGQALTHFCTTQVKSSKLMTDVVGGQSEREALGERAGDRASLRKLTGG